MLGTLAMTGIEHQCTDNGADFHPKLTSAQNAQHIPNMNSKQTPPTTVYCHSTQIFSLVLSVANHIRNIILCPPGCLSFHTTAIDGRLSLCLMRINRLGDRNKQLRKTESYPIRIPFFSQINIASADLMENGNEIVACRTNINILTLHCTLYCSTEFQQKQSVNVGPINMISAFRCFHIKCSPLDSN